MAPDINALAEWAGTDGYANNQVPRNPYTIPDIVLHGPYTRKIKVLSIGAGTYPTPGHEQALTQDRCDWVRPNRNLQRREVLT
jgi:hypothetical protein